MKPLAISVMACLLALMPSFGMAEQALGRLFFTPDQRARMDVARQQERSVRIDVEEEAAPPPANIMLNGVITRSDGKTTVWINNKAQSGAQAGQGIAVQGKSGAGGQVSVALPDARSNVQLKVGQSLDVTSGKVEEVYRRTLPRLEKAETPPSLSGTTGAEKFPVPPARQPSRKWEMQDTPAAVDSQDGASTPR